MRRRGNFVLIDEPTSRQNFVVRRRPVDDYTDRPGEVPGFNSRTQTLRPLEVKIRLFDPCLTLATGQATAASVYSIEGLIYVGGGCRGQIRFQGAGPETGTSFPDRRLLNSAPNEVAASQILTAFSKTSAQPGFPV